MGSIYAKPSVTNEIAPFVTYLCAKSEAPLILDTNVELVVKPSQLPSGFIHGYHEGLFTKKDLLKGTVICSADNEISRKMNDGMVNVEPLLLASNSQDTYNAWVDIKKKYYDLEKAKEAVNVRMVAGGSGIYFETLCDIPAGGELIRMYGFTTWTLELFNILTNKNIAGFSKFIQELDGTLKGDPYEERVSKLRTALKSIISEADTVNLIEYDQKHSSEALVYLETAVQAAYVLTYNQ